MTAKPDYFNAVLNYRRPDSSRISGYITGGETLEQAAKELERAIDFYLKDPQLIDDHIIIVSAVIDKCCGTCGGIGQVKKGKRLYAMKVCPTCKGNAQTRVETWCENEVKVCG